MSLFRQPPFLTKHTTLDGPGEHCLRRLARTGVPGGGPGGGGRCIYSQMLTLAQDNNSSRGHTTGEGLSLEDNNAALHIGGKEGLRNLGEEREPDSVMAKA